MAGPLPLPTKLGEVIEQDGYSLSALTVEDPSTPDAMFYEPTPGTRLVAIEYVVGNVSAKPFTFYQIFATVVDSEGFRYEAESAAMASYDGVEMAELAPGESVRGWGAYELGERAKPAYLEYAFDMYGGMALQVSLAD